MNQPVFELDHLDQELADLRVRFTEGAARLQALADLQQRLIGLADTYETLMAQLGTSEQRWSQLAAAAQLTIDHLDGERAEFQRRFQEIEQASEAAKVELRSTVGSELQAFQQQFTDLEHANAAGLEGLRNKSDETRLSLEQRFASLEAQNAEQWKAFREELVAGQNGLHAALRNVRTELNAQLNQHVGDIERRLERLRSELAGQSEEALGQGKAVAAEQAGLKQHIASLELRLQDQTRAETNQYRLGCVLQALILVIAGCALALAFWAAIR